MFDAADMSSYTNDQGARARKLFAAVVLAALDDAVMEQRKSGTGAENIARWARSKDGSADHDLDRIAEQFERLGSRLQRLVDHRAGRGLAPPPVAVPQSPARGQVLLVAGTDAVPLPHAAPGACWHLSGQGQHVRLRTQDPH